MKDNELKLIAELMKNSHRSDRELAKAVGTSQPTVTRNRRKLEKEGYINEYTIIPNFPKLGYEILAVTLVKLKQPLSKEQVQEAKKIIQETMKVTPLEVVLLERGEGIEADGVLISYHKNYSAHVQFIELLRETGFLNLDLIKSFRINLKDEVRFIPLTLSNLAQCIPGAKETKK